MTMPHRRVIQPGPIHPDRIETIEGAMHDFVFAPQTNVPLVEAIAAPLRARGFAGGGVVLEGAVLAPLRFVMPAFSPDDDHVAYYSATHAPEGPVTIAHANITVGERDGAPFIHCHALWRDAAGALRGGHVLPDQTVLVAPGRARAFASRGATMISRPDAETNFTLFQPAGTPEPASADTARGVIARLRPNEDLVEAIETICARHAIRAGRIRTLVGSLAGVEFDDGRRIDEIPTEILLRAGRISTGPDGRATLAPTIALIDTQGRIHEGRPRRGRNPVLICCELVIEIEAGGKGE